MSKRNTKESMICLTPKPSQSCIVYHLQSKEKFYRKKSFSRGSGSRGLNQKRKEGFSTALATVIKKDPTTLIRKYANESVVHEKIVKIAIKD